MPSSAAMNVRMSNAPAVCLVSVAAGEPVVSSSLMVLSSPEDQVQADDHREGDAGQDVRLLPPRQLSLVLVVEVLLGGQAVDQPTQLGLLARRGHHRDAGAHEDVDHEG